MNSEFSKPFNNILDTIGNTPITRVRCFDTSPCELYVKLENQNPGGSIKDRIAKAMIGAAEQQGKLKPGGTIVEATAGNTGLGLALVAARQGYRLILVVPDKMSSEKIANLKAYGAEVIITRSDVGRGHPEYYQDYAERLARESGAYFINQFNNPANPAAHEATTAVEIWEQMEHNVDAIVCGVGSGGTITGISRFMAQHSPRTEIVLADPAGSILAHYVNTGEISHEVGSWLVEGIGEDFIPQIADLSRVKAAFTISDRESLFTARELLRKEGILAGSSSGTLIAAAVRYAKAQKTPKRILTFVCDSGNKYFSKMLSDSWMMEEGFIEREPTHDLRDMITRFYDRGETVFTEPTDTLTKAHNKMRQHAISQLPVLQQGKIVGLIDESDMLRAILSHQLAFSSSVAEAMTTKVMTLPPSASIAEVAKLLDNGYVALITEHERFVGIVTLSDMINYMRLKHKKDGQ